MPVPTPSARNHLHTAAFHQRFLSPIFWPPPGCAPRSQMCDCRIADVLARLRARRPPSVRRLFCAPREMATASVDLEHSGVGDWARLEELSIRTVLRSVELSCAARIDHGRPPHGASTSEDRRHVRFRLRCLPVYITACPEGLTICDCLRYENVGATRRLLPRGLGPAFVRLWH